ncbi:hypothetical protein ABT218_28975 [Streptomyces sp. NPDC001455]|uniref:hypothetical protein n=1 Tax=Streptomyces sp. NPDC001455 TaxID=3154518 RepID=UPI00331A08AE
MEKDEQGGDVVLERHASWLTSCHSSASRRCRASGAGLLVGAVRDGGLLHVLGPHRPPREGVGEAPGGVAAEVPSIDIGLRAFGERPSTLGEMIEEGGREVDLVACLPDLLAGERAAAGQGVGAALGVPGGEELQQPPVPGIVDGGQFLGEPSLEQQQLSVGRRQDPGLDEPITQVGH